MPSVHAETVLWITNNSVLKSFISLVAISLAVPRGSCNCGVPNVDFCLLQGKELRRYLGESGVDASADVSAVPPDILAGINERMLAEIGACMAALQLGSVRVERLVEGAGAWYVPQAWYADGSVLMVTGIRCGGYAI